MRETLRVSIPNPQSSRSFFYSHVLNVAFCTGHFPGFNRRGIPKEAGQEAADQREQTACQKNCPSLYLWTQHIVPLKKPLSLYVVSIRLFLTSSQFFMPPRKLFLFCFPILSLYSVCQELLVSTLLFSARGRLSISLRKRGRAAADEGYITFKSLKMLK